MAKFTTRAVITTVNATHIQGAYVAMVMHHDHGAGSTDVICGCEHVLMGTWSCD